MKIFIENLTSPSAFVWGVGFLGLWATAKARLSSPDASKHRRTETWDCPPVTVQYPDSFCVMDGKQIHRWTADDIEDHSRSTACLMAIYDTVYEVKGFIDIHRGGPDSIIRNCGNSNATFGYESLACIPGVPDHIPGVLHMLEDNFCSSVVGVMKDSLADPCFGNDVVDLPIPDFESCRVYDVLTCDHLTNMPNSGHWNLEKVKAESASSCHVILYNYVFALGLPPQDNPFTPPGSGLLTFENKHGGGPTAVRNNCQTDMTAVFETMINQAGVPDHTPGALNAVLPYLVGVVEGSNVDPCVPGQEPPHPCDIFVQDHFTMEQVRNSDRSRCWVVVLGKVYDLQEFKVHHHGGADEIEEHCRQDITNDFFEKSFHTLVQLSAVQRFQIGVIADSMADPCSDNYVPNPEYRDGETTSGDSESEDPEESEDSESEDSDD